MLKIRLSRIGKRGQAYFRLVVVEHTKKPKGKYLELLGSYDPHKKTLQAKKDRIEHWIGQGVQLSPTVNNLLINHNIISGNKVQSWKPKKSNKQQKAGDNKKSQAAETATEAKPEEALKTEEPAAETNGAVAEEPKEEIKPEETPSEEKKEEPAETQQ